MTQMGALIDSAMRGGAMGLGTGLIYLPSTFFSTEELIGLTKYVVPYRGGYAAHIRSEGAGLLSAVRETIRIASEAGTWAEIRHIKSRSPEQMAEALRIIDSARAAGIDVTADQYPYIASGTGLAAMLNTWVQEGGSDSLVVRLHDPAVRQRLKTELAEDSAAGIRTAANTMVNSVSTDSRCVRSADERSWKNQRDLFLIQRGCASPRNEEAVGIGGPGCGSGQPRLAWTVGRARTSSRVWNISENSWPIRATGFGDIARVRNSKDDFARGAARGPD
jgi:hypothetical protein